MLYIIRIFQRKVHFLCVSSHGVLGSTTFQKMNTTHGQSVSWLKTQRRLKKAKYIRLHMLFILILSSLNNSCGLTRRTKLRHRWRLICRRRSVGRSLRIASSSTPWVATHLYWSYFRTYCLSSCGSCLWCIHCSVSALLSLHSSNRAVADMIYICQSKNLLHFRQYYLGKFVEIRRLRLSIIYLFWHYFLFDHWPSNLPPHSNTASL